MVCRPLTTKPDLASQAAMALSASALPSSACCQTPVLPREKAARALIGTVLGLSGTALSELAAARQAAQVKPQEVGQLYEPQGADMSVTRFVGLYSRHRDA